MTLQDLYFYTTFAGAVIGLFLLIGSATPKGFRTVVTTWNWLQEHVLSTHLYAEIHRLDEQKADKLEAQEFE